jgi:hypothetical protein
MKRTPLKRQSNSKSSRERRTSYAKAKKEYMHGREGKKNHCERCEGLIGIDCLDLHHKAGRSGSSENENGEMERNLTNKKNFMAVCRKCHDWIHRNPKISRENNWLI